MPLIYAGPHRIARKDMGIREYLEQREKELLESIDFERQQIEKHQLSLVPLEGELAEVRRAKSAIGINTSGVENLAGSVSSDSPYAHLTMKQLVMRALGQQFREGATRSELVEFFRNAWGRHDIEPTSLSPQLSRLMSDGLITYEDNDHRWILTSEGALLAMPVAALDAEIQAGRSRFRRRDLATRADGRRLYRRQKGRFSRPIWLHDNEVTENDTLAEQSNRDPDED